MIDWMARARAQLRQGAQGGTARTDETRVLSVSSAPGQGAAQRSPGVSSVSSVAGPAIVEIDGRAGAPTQVTAANDALVAAPAPTPAVSRGNPYMTPEQGDECHACGWDDAEIECFIARARRFALLGRADAEHLAERLTLRDRQDDDRAMCVECRELAATGRCAAARRGALLGADRRLEPVPNILMRCECFTAAMKPHRLNRVNDDQNHNVPDSSAVVPFPVATAQPVDADVLLTHGADIRLTLPIAAQGKHLAGKVSVLLGQSGVGRTAE